jgi:predicted TIM-barrel fold metal-dependent hydrolase
MAKKSNFRGTSVFWLIPALILAGFIGKEVAQRLDKAQAETQPQQEEASPPPAAAAAASQSETPEEALQRIIDSRRIVNVHEHIQDIRQGPTVLEAKDRFGIGRTLLMGSSWFTITLNERVGFTRYDQNNEELIKIAQEWPDRFLAYPTIAPDDPEKLEKVKDLVARGAKGVKLYLGHGYTRRDGEYMFHVVAMDDPDMFPFYEYCEQNYIPLCFHMQPFKPGFAQEFIAVATAFPDLKMNVPHFILSSIRQSRLREFLDTFPNVYSDISFGHDDFLIPGLRRISNNKQRFRKLFMDYPDRFMFATDLVVTEHHSKTAEWFGERAQAYYNMLTKSEYTVPFIPGETLKGLELTGPVLDNILYANYERFETMRPQGTKITREIDWSQMGIPKLEREPGQTFPAPPPAPPGGN